MTISSILSSPSQRRTFLLSSFLIILVSAIAIFAIALLAPNTPGWSALNSFLISIVASGVFALVSGLYISYFFVNPHEMAANSIVLPKDIGQTLLDMAKSATDYKIYVRTGRHFRADILPILVKQAYRSRQPIKIEAILIDFRDTDICEKYATYRNNASFDRKEWNTSYVQKEVMATILALINASNDYRGLIDIDLFLSKRLSNFRFDGTSDAFLVTREDPKDTASRYLRTHRDFSAFVIEFNWIRDEAHRIEKGTRGALPVNLQEMFGVTPVIAELEESAREASHARSPYAR